MNANLIYFIAGGNFLILLAGSLLFYDYLRSSDRAETAVAPVVFETPIAVSLESETHIAENSTE